MPQGFENQAGYGGRLIDLILQASDVQIEDRRRLHATFAAQVRS